MRLSHATTLRTRLTLWYVGVLAVLLLVYATLVFVFQYAVLTRQLVHDEVQDVVTVEGLLYFDGQGQLQLRQNYYSRPQSRLLVDRLMEVRETPSGAVLYRSPTLHGMSLGGKLRAGEGDGGFNERLVRLADGTHLFVVSHVHGMDGKTLVIRLGYDIAPLHKSMNQFCLMLLLGIPLGLVLAGALGQLVARRALRPLEKMALRAEGITANNLNDRLEIANANDELGQMAGVFNALLQRLEQAFSQLQRFTADAAHELRTPLASVRAMGEIALQESRTPETYRNTLSDILEETSRLNETVDSLLLLSRAEAIQPGPQTAVAVWPLVDEVLNLLEIVMEERSVRVVEDGEPDGNVMVLADRSLLRIAILNVLHNAVKFSPKNSVLRIAYATIDSSPALLKISFQDQGPGILAGEEERVFERFFTSSATAAASHSGVGLGLAISKLIIERTGGTIAFAEGVREGARCVIELPVAPVLSTT